MICVVFLMLSLVVITDAVLIVLWNPKTSIKTFREEPLVSILIAARNEEHNIETCLNSLLQLNYPIDKIQILVGDDNSSDRTFEVAEKVLRHFSNSKIISITENVAHQKGKANVLAQLAHYATGEYLFITDADMLLPKNWITNMLAGLNEGVGIVTGVTHPADHKWQSLDWLFALGIVKVMHDHRRPVTAMGNNMMITREAYDAVGGYEGIPFSVTEDFELFRQTLYKGYRAIQLYDKSVLGETKPVSDFFKLLQQRKRWMIGAVRLHWSIVSILFIQALYFPLIILALVLNTKLASLFIILKILIQTIFIKRCINKLNIKYSYLSLIVFEFYSWGLGLASSLYYLLPVGVSWKGRKY